MPLLGVAGGDLWKRWEREVRRQCPANHVEWLADGAHDELLTDFAKTLPRATQKRVDAIADYAHRCADAQIGFYCEMRVHLDAFERLGLLRRFAVFACRRYKCSEPAFCVKNCR
jgi:hypothetical protein